MTTTADQVEAFWAWLNPRPADPRVAEWPLMDSVYPTLYISAAYIAFVVLGPKVMARLPPWENIKPFMVLYNTVVIVLNVYMLYGFVGEAWAREYKWICNPIDESESGTRMAFFVYVYYLSKVLDFMDTFFIVARKKFDQLSFLHVYHHVSMFFIWWIGAKWGNGGDAIFGPLCNSFVHMVMYTYYLGSTLKIHIPGKKYLTQLQMIQFFIVVSHSALNVFLDCPFPKWMHISQIIFLCSLFGLFMNFYIKAYSPARGAPRAGPKPKKS